MDTRHMDDKDLLQLVTPDDLMRYGMIPEIVGRLPVTISVDPLDIISLRAILTKPRNALVRQYQRLFEMDNVELQFTSAALDAAAELALKRETGARGLRAIIEGVLLDVMYEIPTRPEVQTVKVDKDAITRAGRPRLLNAKGKELPFEDEILSDAA
jgi:ATP-dependent Clp protease ATP-binding subunit ClpX